MRELDVTVMSKNRFLIYFSQEHERRVGVIRIWDPWETPVFNEIHPNSNVSALCTVQFADSDSIERNGITDEQGKILAEFIKMSVNSGINEFIVHCYAGQSRSAGVAAAILKYYNNDDFKIFNNIRYTPNMLCYRTVLRNLEL